MFPPNQVFYSVPVNMCHFVGCRNAGIYRCNAVVCCKKYGCGKMMCSDHTSKRFFGRGSRQGGKQKVCLNEERNVFIYYLIFKIILPIMLISWFFRGIFG